MGNKQKSQKSNFSSTFSDIEDLKERSRQFNVNVLQQDFENTRNQMVTAWVGLMIKTLKKNQDTFNGWRSTCEKMEKAIRLIDPYLYQKVFSLTESLSCTQAVQSRVKQLCREGRKDVVSKRSESFVIDIKTLSKRMSLRSRRIQGPGSSQLYPQGKQQKQLKQGISLILQHEFNQEYHPFLAIKSIFIQDLIVKYDQFLKTYKCSGESEDQTVMEVLTEDLTGICSFFLRSCQIYKEWVQGLTNLKQKGYVRYMKRIIIRSLYKQPSRLHSLLLRVLKTCNDGFIQSVVCNLKQNVNICKFNIKKQLEVEGNYTRSLIMISEVDKVLHPYKFLKFLNQLKTQIQNDIQFWNHHVGIVQKSTIDGDNLLSILCFILCRMKFKLPDLHSQLMILHVVYGDEVLVQHDSASYMLTALTAAIDYLKTEQFALSIA